ncbi:MAG: response regulator [Thermoleophilia bacterium]|nr:response regulator [Thermoleophilia bacterium]
MSTPPDMPPSDAFAAGAAVVLLVDDQPIFASTIAHMLQGEADIAFHSCERGSEAVARAAALRPTVILQDLHMPDADGLELLGAYRGQEATRLTPLVVLSGEGEPSVKAEAFARGADDYVSKMPDKAELIARIRYHSRAYRLMLMERELVEAERRRLIERRHRDALRARNTLIFALAKLAESRDAETGQHLERIAAYCRVLAEQIRAARPELTDEWIVSLQLASSLHDIGKVGIPDAVLLKPGRLDAQERRVIERHPEIGAAALDAIIAHDRADALLKMARNIAASHHERWDGAGYPAGLSGESIPLEARIVSVADVYDALTSRRVYKPAVSHREAVAAITVGRGTQFDPLVVDALLARTLAFRQAGELLHEHVRGSIDAV